MMMALPDKFLGTSLAPRPEVDYEKRRKNADERRVLEESKRKYQKENAARNNKIKLKTVLLILCIASALFVTIFRSGLVYLAQNQFVTLQSETREMTKSNEALQANLIKASAIGELKEKAEILNLAESIQGLGLTVDLSVNHFGEEEIIDQPTKILDRLFSFIN